MDHPGTDFRHGGRTGKKLIRRAALVLSEIPGITYDALAAMDVREFNTWEAEARRTRALRRHHAMQAAQTPHMKEKGYRAIMKEIKADMYGPDDWAAEAAAKKREQADNLAYVLGICGGGEATAEQADRETARATEEQAESAHS